MLWDEGDLIMRCVLRKIIADIVISDIVFEESCPLTFMLTFYYCINNCNDVMHIYQYAQ